MRVPADIKRTGVYLFYCRQYRGGIVIVKANSNTRLSTLKVKNGILINRIRRYKLEVVFVFAQCLYGIVVVGIADIKEIRPFVR